MWVRVQKRPSFQSNTYRVPSFFDVSTSYNTQSCVETFKIVIHVAPIFRTLYAHNSMSHVAIMRWSQGGPITNDRYKYIRELTSHGPVRLVSSYGPEGILKRGSWVKKIKCCWFSYCNNLPRLRSKSDSCTSWLRKLLFFYHLIYAPSILMIHALLL